MTLETLEKLAQFVNENNRANINDFFEDVFDDLDSQLLTAAFKAKIFLGQILVEGIGIFVDATNNQYFNVCDGFIIDNFNEDDTLDIEVYNLVKNIPEGRMKNTLQIRFYPSDENLPSILFEGIERFFNSNNTTVDCVLKVKNVALNNSSFPEDLKRTWDCESYQNYQDYWLQKISQQTSGKIGNFIL